MANYGNENNAISTCPQCEEPIGRHAISIIKSTDKSYKLAETLQGLLVEVNIDAVNSGFTLDRESTMIGAAYVNYKSATHAYVTTSGPGVVLLNHINKKGIAKEVRFVTVLHASMLKITGKKLAPELVEPPILKAKAPLKPNTEPKPEEKAYPVGSCAAQKLLYQIFIDAKGMKESIKSIEMSEIMWRMASDENVGKGSRMFRTTGAAEPCWTCKQVLPQMLCDRS